MKHNQLVEADFLTSEKKHSCTIVGAGISGLVAASILQDNGIDVIVLDKARGVGGRMATRRISDEELGIGIFDHGAQFFTVRDKRFGDLVKFWKSQGVVKKWCNGFPTPESSEIDGYPRYRGSQGMSSIPKYLANKLDIKISSKVSEIKYQDQKWKVITETGDEFISDSLILTPPVPQSMALIDASGFKLPKEIKKTLEKISYAPCIAIMAFLQGTSNVPEPGGLQLSGEPISWIADNRMKGISPETGGVTIHAGPEFSRNNWNKDDKEISDFLLKSADKWLGSEIRQVQVHKWHYGLPLELHAEPYLFVQEPKPLLFAGDAFAGPRVEGAAISGMEAANRLLLEFR